jgi:hypothetical protein
MMMQEPPRISPEAGVILDVAEACATARAAHMPARLQADTAAAGDVTGSIEQTSIARLAPGEMA